MKAVYYSCLKAIVLCLAILLSSASLVIFGSASPAHAANDYPWSNAVAVPGPGHQWEWGYTTCPTNDTGCMLLKNIGSDGNTYGESDPWGYYFRNCTSWVAWKLSQQGFDARGLGNALSWGPNARSKGFTLDMNPAVGAVAWFAANAYGMSGYGHVAWVSSISADRSHVTIEEYNNAVNGGWGSRTIPTGNVSGYIHFADISAGGNTSPPAPPPPSGSSPIQNGGFNADTSHWGTSGTANLARYTASSGMGTNPYEGNGFAATNASQSGDSIYETNVATVHAGDTYCASAYAVTVGNASSGSGQLALWLTGGTANDVSTYVFSGLPGNNGWRELKTCVTATTSQSYIKVQVYPSVGSPTIGMDAVDVHQTLSANGGFNGGTGYWNVQPGTNFTSYAAADNVDTNPYEGARFAATNTATSGGSVFQDLPRDIAPGDTFCASAQVVTVGNTTGGAGALYVYLTGANATEESHYSFSNLPGGNSWTPANTCVTATSAHSNIRVQLYPAVNVPTIGVDALDVHSSVIQNGGLNGDSSHWGATGGLSYMNWGNYNGTLPYEGSGFESIQASSSSDTLVEARSWQFGVGDTFCASAQVITPGQGSGGSGVLAIWLLGPNGSENSAVAFSGLPGQNNWTPIKTCVTASIAETYGTIQVQFYPTPGGPPVAVDAVDVH